jgi:glycosyltransferase involved in cell wall biosynthesis
VKTKSISIIIPARNEEALIGATIEAVLRSAADLCATPAPPDLPGSPVEVIVVDNASVDRTTEIAARYVEDHGVRLVHCMRLKAPCARNFGARHALGDVLMFVDADTLVPPDTLRRVLHWCDAEGYEAGITGLASREGGLLAGLWWRFWCLVRRLPLARAKAMPACMFCTRAAFDEFGPFDERVVIGEEWPILAGLYRARPERLIYDRALVALTSSRRMELQRWGYLRTLCKYVWAIMHVSGRLEYDDRVRHVPMEAE